jgi:hypothetical protein
MVSSRLLAGLDPFFVARRVVSARFVSIPYVSSPL